MSAPPQLSAVAPHERLARFIFSPQYVRPDGRIKAEAFVPFPHVELSVTRHGSLQGSQLMNIGQQIGSARKKPLIGRADIEAKHCTNVGLTVTPDPLPNNPDHANVSNWPAEKHKQKILALQLANSAQYRKQ